MGPLLGPFELPSAVLLVGHSFVDPLLSNLLNPSFVPTGR